jgi:hypothetical protein
MSIGAGKGSTPRPVDPKKWSDGYDHAFKRKAKPKVHKCAIACADCAFYSTCEYKKGFRHGKGR